VGETGVGKTALLDLFANALQGLGPENYQETHFPSNEAGGSKGGSQTKEALLYKFESLNGIQIRILDTPGLADTRGFAYDEQHKASFVQAIHDNIPVIDGVLIVVNGTNERLQVATDYALATLASIFPNSIVDNIAFIFTMVPNRLNFNFQLDSLPEGLRKANFHYLDNPIALMRKYNQVKQESLRGTQPQLARNLERTWERVHKTHNTSIAMLSRFFRWLDERETKQTTDIVDLHKRFYDIVRRIQDTVVKMNDISELKTSLGALSTETDNATQVCFHLIQNHQHMFYTASCYGTKQ
jgi:hypothetical protein